MRKRLGLLAMLGLTALSATGVQAAPPATQPAIAPAGERWVAYVKNGVDAVPYVQVNQGTTRAVLAVLPDGRVAMMVHGTSAHTPEEQAIAWIVQSAPLVLSMKQSQNRPLMGLPDLSEDQWKQLAKLHVSPTWMKIDSTSQSVQPMVAAMRSWATMPDGPARVEFETKVLSAVQSCTSPTTDQARDELKTAVDQVTKMVSKDELDRLAKRFAPMAMPAGGRPWMPYDFRPEGVYGGLVLLVGDGSDQGSIHVRVGWGAAIGNEMLVPTNWEGCSAYYAQLWGRKPGFLSGEATMLVELRSRRPGSDPRLGMECSVTPDGRVVSYIPPGKGKADGGALLRYLCEVEPHAKLSDFGLSADQQTSIAQLQKKIDAAQKPQLKLDDGEVAQLRQCMEDWWHGNPDRDSAAKALEQKLHNICQPKIATYRAYEDLWAQMGDVLTDDQKQAIVKATSAVRAMPSLPNPAAQPVAPPNEPNPGL